MKTLFLALFALSLTTTSFGAGGWSGGSSGAEYSRDQNNIWYLSGEPVEYCIDRDHQYPLDLSMLQTLVKESFQAWNAFFKKYQLADKVLGKKLQPPLPFWLFPDGTERGLAQDFREVPCAHLISNGLTFLFGKSDDRISSLQGQFKNSLGFAIREEYNHLSYRQAGIIWIRNPRVPWSMIKPPEPIPTRPIKHILLHEIGHLFGMHHNSVFVMDEAIANELESNVGPHPVYAGSIESPAWKYRLRSSDTIDLTDRANCISYPRPIPGFLSSNEIPQEARELLKLGGNECAKIKLRYEFEPSEKRKLFSLIVEHPPGQNSPPRALFSGDFGLLAPERPSGGPGLYTRWLTPKNEESWTYLPLDTEINPLPAAGFFSFQSDKVAAVIGYNRGPILKIFLPKKGQWWELKEMTSNWGASGIYP